MHPYRGTLLACLLIVAAPASASVTSTEEQTGLVGCSVTMRPFIGLGGSGAGIGPTGGADACGFAGVVDDELGTDTSQIDRYRLYWDVQPPEDLAWVSAQMSMSWQANEASTSSLYMEWWVDGCINQQASRLAYAWGTSPLEVTVSSDAVAQVLAESDCAANVGCTSESCSLVSRTFSWIGTLGDDAPADAGWAIGQSFTQTMVATFA